MPTACDQSTEPAIPRRLGVGVHRLRVVLAGEVDDLGFADRDGAGREDRAWRVVLEIAFGRTAHRGSGKSMTWTSSLAVSSTAQLSWKRLAESRGSPAEPGLITSTGPMRRTTC